MNSTKFWLVWNRSNRAPRVEHPSFEDAKNEASRLATKQPGEAFIVLQSCGLMVVREPTTWEPHH